MSERLSAGRRSQTRALVGCGRWKSVGPDCPSHCRWSTPVESGHINSAAQTPGTCPEAVKRLSQRTLPLAGCSVSPRLLSSGYSCIRRLSQDTPGRGRTIPVV